MKMSLQTLWRYGCWTSTYSVATYMQLVQLCLHVTVTIIPTATLYTHYAFQVISVSDSTVVLSM